MKTVKILTALALIIAIERFCHRQTGSFSLYKITTDCSEDFAWKRAPSSKGDEQEILPTLDQPFTYLGEGAQCVAFLSQDKQTVLKFFKLHLVRMGFLRMALRTHAPELSFFEKVRKARQEKLTRTFDSLSFSFDSFRKETGLLYLHLAPTKYLDQQVTIYDKIGVKQTIDLDNTLFFVQKKAEPVYETLDKLMNAEETTKAETCIYSLMALMRKRSAMGLSDIDPRINYNFGFVGTDAIEFDIGSFSRDASELAESRMKKELTLFRSWIKTHHPTLLHCLDETYI